MGRNSGFGYHTAVAIDTVFATNRGIGRKSATDSPLQSDRRSICMLDAILSTSKEAFDSVENGAVSARS